MEACNDPFQFKQVLCFAAKPPQLTSTTTANVQPATMAALVVGDAVSCPANDMIHAEFAWNRGCAAFASDMFSPEACQIELILIY